jgi:hypothetical protein
MSLHTRKTELPFIFSLVSPTHAKNTSKARNVEMLITTRIGRIDQEMAAASDVGAAVGGGSTPGTSNSDGGHGSSEVEV